MGDYTLNDLGGLTLPKGEAAIVTSEGMTKLVLLIPDLQGEAAKRVPDMVLYLTACMARGNRDPEFVQEQIEWFKAGGHG